MFSCPTLLIHLAVSAWWRHQTEAFCALLAICAGNSPVPGEFPTQRPATRSFDVYFDLCLNKRLCKQSWGWWFEALLCPSWRQSNVTDKQTNWGYMVSRLKQTIVYVTFAPKRHLDLICVITFIFPRLLGHQLQLNFLLQKSVFIFPWSSI